MIFSMTGFSILDITQTWGTAILEIRSVNHRFLEPSLRLPEKLRPLEIALREKLRSYINRGKIDFSLKIELTSDTQLNLNYAVIQELGEKLASLKPYIHNGSVSLFDVLKYPNVVEDQTPDMEQITADILQAFERLLQEFNAMRKREGEKLALVIEDRLQKITLEVAKVQDHMPEILEWQRQKLKNRFEELQLEVDNTRIEQEMVILAQRLDVAEELDRLTSHIHETRRILAQGGACGRKLDFMMQELNREANTLSSKSINTDITANAVEIKVLIEQMREQIQNLE